MAWRPKNNLIPVSAAWPFQKWGVDIVGPFPEAAGRLKFLIVAVDYFTKWVEAKPLATITAANVKKFLWEHIICRFGVPLYLVSNNGKQFADGKLQEWCQELNIKQIFTSVAHPLGNGQVERTNRSIVEGIKARLGYEGVSWVDELAHVLWAHRTMNKTSHGETPFSLTYGTEAMIPAEIGLPSARSQNICEIENNEKLKRNLDMLEARREMAAIREEKYKRKMEASYNKKVLECVFKEGDFVLRSNAASKAEPTGKLAPNWEGPYTIHKVAGKGAYVLEKLDYTPLPRMWNGAQLRKCYM
jgi:transposase InsO family protein